MAAVVDDVRVGVLVEMSIEKADERCRVEVAHHSADHLAISTLDRLADQPIDVPVVRRVQLPEALSNGFP